MMTEYLLFGLLYLGMVLAWVSSVIRSKNQPEPTGTGDTNITIYTADVADYAMEDDSDEWLDNRFRGQDWNAN